MALKIKRRYFTPEEVEAIIKIFPHMKTRDLALAFGLTYSQVSNLAYKHNIHKSETFKKTLWPRFDGSEGKNYRFVKGQEPPNKGKKMPTDLYQKCAPTMFKKGHKPHNAKYDGYERISVDGYREIRIAKGKFKKVHRMVWEEHNGEIPKGMVVVLKTTISSIAALKTSCLSHVRKI